jgi:hypothetical protein
MEPPSFSIALTSPSWHDGPYVQHHKIGIELEDEPQEVLDFDGSFHIMCYLTSGKFNILSSF